MVARINSAKRLLGILNYNENKVKEGNAKCILENGFGYDVGELTIKDKLKNFEEYDRGNRRTRIKSVHISLNFHPGEKLSERKLQEIATEYMDRIGFGNQPYLVYQHFDVDHPHVHIVTTRITRDGSRIDMHNIGRKKSEPARKAIEQKYKLAKASISKNQYNPDIRKVIYGKMPTKKSLADVVREVIKTYKFTSLPEFNAVLKQFNVLADRGAEESKIFQKGGLVYRILDEQGKKVGVPIKASSLPGKPMLSELGKHFKTNEVLRRPFRDRLIKVIDDVLSTTRKQTTKDFSKGLEKEGIVAFFRANDEGRIYGITFVDNKSKVVFNGSDLGRLYSAKAILERLTTSKITAIERAASESVVEERNATRDIDSITNVVETLMEAKQLDFTTPEAAMKVRKRKRRKAK